jgi:hypothetical protein
MKKYLLKDREGLNDEDDGVKDMEEQSQSLTAARV